MKLAILSSHAGNDIEPTVQANLLSHLPNQVSNVNDADAVIIPVSYQPNFAFNPKLHEVENKKRIILDFIECGWQAGDKNNIFGTGMTQQFGHLNTVDYAKFDQWVAANPPALTLKRELFKRDASPTMLPVEWPCYIPARPVHSKEQFNTRPFATFHSWGLSNPQRPRLHGKTFLHAHDNGIHVIDGWRDQHLERNNWVTIYCPWQVRKNIMEVIRWQRRAKISVSLWGAGQKTFRDNEAPVDCIMARPIDELAWSFPWDQSSSIQLRPGFEFEDLLAATKRDDLYDVYLAGLANVENYRSANYCRHITRSIESIL